MLRLIKTIKDIATLIVVMCIWTGIVMGGFYLVYAIFPSLNSAPVSDPEPCTTAPLQIDNC